MNDKELVLRSLDHLPVDRLPRDVFEGWMWPGIAGRLMEETGAEEFEELLIHLGACCRWVTPRYIGPPLPAGAADRVASPHTVHSLNASIWGLKPGLREHGQKSGGHPLASAETVEEILRRPWPRPEWFDYDGMRAQAARHKDRFLIAGGFSPLFYLIADLCGMEKALMDMALNPALIEALVFRITEFYKGYFSAIADVAKGVVDAIAFGDDFASQESMLMSPTLWRRFFKGAWAELFRTVKDRGVRVMFHSCGAMSRVIPDLIEAGLDILYPMQPRARDMDLASLKQRFGDTLCFYGGVDVQELLPFGSPAQVRGEADRLEELFRQGGFILSTSHVIMEDAPAENVLALYGTK